MTVLGIFVKMFKENIRRFRLYVLCSFLAVTVFFCFASIFTNQSFMGTAGVDAVISYNIIFPSVLTAVFLLLFIPYSYSVFLSARAQEYGILLSFGLGRADACKYLFAEGMALGAAVLAASLVAGTLMSFAFFAFLSRVVGITALQWGMPWRAYAVTSGLYGASLVVSVILMGVKMLKRSVRALLKAPYEAEGKGSAYRFQEKIFPGYARKHLLEFSLLARHRWDWAARYFFSAVLVGCVLYLLAVCTVLSSTLLRDVENYCPYDLVYAEIYGRNGVSQEEIQDILSSHQVSIEEKKQMSFFRDRAFNYLAVSEVNEKLGCSYQVPAGMFLNLFQIDMEDGYGHELPEVSQISLPLGTEGESKLRSCGSDVRIIFNKSRVFADYTVILNDADYARIERNRMYCSGIMHLFKFGEWQGSSVGVAHVQSFLRQANGLNREEQRQYGAVSKIEHFREARQSVQFLVFLSCFVMVLLLLAAFVLIRFRIAAEWEENRRVWKSLFLVGISDGEYLRLCRYKNRMRFFPPVMASLPISLPFICGMGEGVYHSEVEGCVAGIVASSILLAVTEIYTYCFSKKESQALKQCFFDSMGKTLCYREKQ